MRTSLLFPRILLFDGCSPSGFVGRLFWLPLHATLATWWRFGLLGLEGWHGFREGGNKEEEELVAETLMGDKKDRGEIEAMVTIGYLALARKGVDMFCLLIIMLMRNDLAYE